MMPADLLKLGLYELSPFSKLLIHFRPFSAGCGPTDYVANATIVIRSSWPISIDIWDDLHCDWANNCGLLAEVKNANKSVFGLKKMLYPFLPVTNRILTNFHNCLRGWQPKTARKWNKMTLGSSWWNPVILVPPKS